MAIKKGNKQQLLNRVKVPAEEDHLSSSTHVSKHPACLRVLEQNTQSWVRKLSDNNVNNNADDGIMWLNVKYLNSVWTQPRKHYETLSHCLAGLEQFSGGAVTFSFTRKVFFSHSKCFVAADVQPRNLMHRDVVSTEREPGTISARTADFWESVGKHDIFILMLGSLHNTERWGI